MFLLLLHQFTAVAAAARRVTETAVGTLPDVGRLGTQLVADAGLAIVVLIVTATLSVFKPWGRTPYGRRKLEQDPREPSGVTATITSIPVGLKILFALVGVVVAAFVAIHLAGGGLHGH
jgi:hypothetical protein